MKNLSLLIIFLLTPLILCGQDIQEGNKYLVKGDTLVVVSSKDLKNSLKKMIKGEGDEELVKKLEELVGLKDQRIQNLETLNSENSKLITNYQKIETEYQQALLDCNNVVESLKKPTLFSWYLGAGITNIPEKPNIHLSIGFVFKEKFIITATPGIMNNSVTYGGSFLFKIF